MANPLSITPRALAAATGSGNGSSVDLSASVPVCVRSGATLTLEVTAVDDPATKVTVSLQTSADGSTNWRTVDSWPAQGVGSVEQSFADLNKFCRVSWAATGTSGTPTTTFVVAGDAHQLFLDTTDITSAQLPAKALASVAKTVIAKAMISASGDAEDSMASSYTLPIVAWSDSVSQRCAQIASFQIMSFRGFQPNGTDELIVKANDDAQGWLKRVAAGSLRPPGIVDSAPTVYEGGAAVVTNARRGW